MSKQFFTREEVKTLLREVIQRKRNEAESVEDKPEAKPVEEKTYTLEEVKALIIKDREARKTS